jgi:hypothetical protein
MERSLYLGRLADAVARVPQIEAVSGPETPTSTDSVRAKTPEMYDQNGYDHKYDPRD